LPRHRRLNRNLRPFAKWNLGTGVWLHLLSETLGNRKANSSLYSWRRNDGKENQLSGLRRTRRRKGVNYAAGELTPRRLEHVRPGKHGDDSPHQAIAIDSTKARRSGVEACTPGKARHLKPLAKVLKGIWKERRSGKKGKSPQAKRYQARVQVLKAGGAVSRFEAAISETREQGGAGAGREGRTRPSLRGASPRQQNRSTRVLKDLSQLHKTGSMRRTVLCLSPVSWERLNRV